MGFTVAIFILVEGLLVTFIVKYRRAARARTVEGVAGARPHAPRADLDGDPGRDHRDHLRLRLLQAARDRERAEGDCGVGSEHPRSPSRRTSSTGSSPIRTARRRSTSSTSRSARSSTSTIVSRGRQPQLVDPGSSAARRTRSPAARTTPGTSPTRPGRSTASAPSSAASSTSACSGASSSRARPEYQSFLAPEPRRQLGKAEWVGVCAKCHGMQGQGDYGPATRVEPDPDAEGEPRAICCARAACSMPAVGDNWSDDADARARDVPEEERLQGGERKWRLGPRPSTR